MLFTRKTGLVLAAIAAVVFACLVGQTSTPLESSAQFRYLATDDTSTSFTTPAPRSLTPLANQISLGTTPGKRIRCAIALPYGTGTAGQTFNIEIDANRRCYASQGSQTLVDYETVTVATATCTLGSTAGVVAAGGSGITVSHLVVDTITNFVVTPAGADLIDAFGGLQPFVYSPGGGAQARIFIPDFFNSGSFDIRSDMTGATSSNFIIEIGT